MASGSWLFEIRSFWFFALVVSFIASMALVYSHVTHPMDNYVIEHMQKTSNPSLDFSMQVITEIGSVFYMSIFSVVLLIIKRTRRLGLVLLLLIVVGTLSSGYMKCLVQRERPMLDYGGVPFPVDIEKDTFPLFCQGLDSSFPSGHATRAVVFAFVIGYVISNKFPRASHLVWLYPVLVSTSRVYVLQHFPMDVIGGTFLGILLANEVSRRLNLHRLFAELKS